MAKYRVCAYTAVVLLVLCKDWTIELLLTKELHIDRYDAITMATSVVLIGIVLWCAKCYTQRREKAARDRELRAADVAALQARQDLTMQVELAAKTVNCGSSLDCELSPLQIE